MSLLSLGSLGLLLPCLITAKPVRLNERLSKRAPSYDVLGGANFPDPSIINVDGLTYAFGTGDGAGNSVPYTTNADFNNPSSWSQVRDSFPSAGVPAFGGSGWAAVDTIWAPDVNRLVCTTTADLVKGASINSSIRQISIVALPCIMLLL